MSKHACGVGGWCVYDMGAFGSFKSRRACVCVGGETGVSHTDMHRQKTIGPPAAW